MTLPRIPAGRWTGVAASLTVSTLAATAQRPDTELARLRTEHEKGLASASRLVDDIHRLTLRQLERERAEAGDYETASRVKARLDALERTPGTAAIIPPPLTHTLLAARAQTRDGANTEGGREYVDFRKTGGKALWDILGLEKGTYEVVLTYSVGLPRFDESTLGDNTDGPREAPGGVVSFGEVTGLGSGPAPTLEKRVVTTGAWENYIRESIGRHEFKNASTTVKLEAVSATDGGLLRLKHIELVKVVGAPEPSAATGTAQEPARSLQALQAKHRQEMKEAAGSLRPRFNSEFLKLEQELTTAGDAAAAAAVAKVRERLFPAAPSTEAESNDAADPIPGLGDEPEEKKP
jgi:hypothetical protein